MSNKSGSMWIFPEFCLLQGDITAGALLVSMHKEQFLLISVVLL